MQFKINQNNELKDETKMKNNLVINKKKEKNLSKSNKFEVNR